MVYPKASNPIENIRSGCKIVPRMFYDHSSKYPTMQWDKKRRTPEEIVQLINAYLPKEWALVLVNLSTSVQAITEEGFLGSRILTLDGNGQRSQKLSDWICEHEGVHFECPSEETIETEERTGSYDQRSSTLEMEKSVKMGGECSEDYIDIPDSGRRNVEKPSRRKLIGSDDSTKEESITHTETYQTESEDQIETSEETTSKAIPTDVKRNRIGIPVSDDKRAVQNKITERAESKQGIYGRKGKDEAVPILSTPKWPFTSKQFTKGIRSKSTRNTASTAVDIQGRGGPRMSTPTLVPGLKKNTV